MTDTLPFSNPLSEAHIALEAAKKASKAVMEIYDQEFTSELKDDDSPITKADLQSNEIIKQVLSSSGLHVLSEEDADDKARLDLDKIWIIDPLDGTSDFVNRTGEFTIMIALVQNAVGSRFHLTEQEKEFFKNLGVASFESRGSSLKVAEICMGLADLYLTTSNKIKQWDTCASHCLITESGGKITDMFGNQVLYNTEKVNHENGLIVTNGLVHDTIVKRYSS
ncbi:MAG: 3'(2'),5'-bisphosphate nucleotidase CysQ [Thaumarchaeota archaeon]|nr:3'(2'),5'-bisphosphate nucleotidase CysQ [Nitrososphaerota archaeon]